MVTRLAKAGLGGALGLFALLVALDNVLDPGSNLPFVRHVLGMDTTFPGGHLRGRALAGEGWAQAGFALIVTGEAVTGLLYLAGSLRLLHRLRAPAPAFDRAKDWSVLAAVSAFSVWFIGFALVGGEWFQMWQSATWNGQEAAFRFTMTSLAVLVFTVQPDREVAGATP